MGDNFADDGSQGDTEEFRMADCLVYLQHPDSANIEPESEEIEARLDWAGKLVESWESAFGVQVEDMPSARQMEYFNSTMTRMGLMG
mmetsp:Transcript_45266/g.111144  ORF Transcript_45266/g.111144 Transcript_45266/m.111144 type:complete len:87 (+) Transcript_45266:52-312(+)